MEVSIYESRARQIISEIKHLIEVKGISLDSGIAGSVISGPRAEEIFSGKILPGLTEFIALCEISGITISMPSVETPENPM